MAKNIIIFQDSTTDEESTLFGFKILNQNSTKQFMKSVSLLSNIGEKFDVNNSSIYYDMEKFEVIKISSYELKVLTKIFNIEDEEESIGIFPDAINDAYEFGLLSDNNDEDDYLNEEYE